jgi:TolB protein
MPNWSPDDNQIVFVSNREGNKDVYIMNADGSEVINLTNHPADDWHPSWSPMVNQP